MRDLSLIIKNWFGWKVKHPYFLCGPEPKLNCLPFGRSVEIKKIANKNSFSYSVEIRDSYYDYSPYSFDIRSTDDLIAAAQHFVFGIYKFWSEGSAKNIAYIYNFILYMDNARDIPVWAIERLGWLLYQESCQLGTIPQLPNVSSAIGVFR